MKVKHIFFIGSKSMLCECYCSSVCNAIFWSYKPQKNRSQHCVHNLWYVLCIKGRKGYAVNIGMLMSHYDVVIITEAFIQAQIKENIKAPRHWPLCGTSPMTSEFPAQSASNAEKVSIWWRHHDDVVNNCGCQFIIYIKAYCIMLLYLPMTILLFIRRWDENASAKHCNNSVNSRKVENAS